MACIYKKLNVDLQDKVDKIILEENKKANKISVKDLAIPRLKTALKLSKYHFTQKEKWVWDFLFDKVFSERLQYSFCKCCDTYELKNVLYMLSNIIDKDRVKDTILDNITETIERAIEDYCIKNICSHSDIVEFSVSICNYLYYNPTYFVSELWEEYTDYYGEGPEFFHQLVYHYLNRYNIIDQVNDYITKYSSDSDSDNNYQLDISEPIYNDPSDLGIGQIIVPSYNDVALGL